MIDPLELRGAAVAADIERTLRRRVFQPAPKLTISEWADRHRMIPPGQSELHGRWRTDRAPYLREIMDALADPRVERVVFKKSKRVGATEAIINVIGFYMDQQPTTIGVMQPTIPEARGWSKEQLQPSIDATPRLTGLLKDTGGRRDPDNTTLRKTFPGGQLFVVGGNSATGLRRRNIQIIIGDEVDAYGVTARGASDEGDPFTLFTGRSENFRFRKIFETSTPTVKGRSRIGRDYDFTDQRQYYVPCPHCGHMQTFKWAQFRWENQDPSTVHYICGDIDQETGELTAGCGKSIGEEHKGKMVRAGEWRPQRPGRPVRGYFIWAAYSLLSTWVRMVQQWLEAQGDREKLKVFVNQVLGEEWEEDAGEEVDPGPLAARRERWAVDVPQKAAVLCAGVDTQGDRLEASVWAFGAGLERWVVRHQVLWGDPLKPDVWEHLALLLFQEWEHETGFRLRIQATAVDSGGHHTDAVYGFCDAYARRNVFPIKGSSTPGAAPVTPPGPRSAHRLVMVGTDAIKDMIYAGLREDEPGPGFIHFPLRLDEEYFRQLTAEEVKTRYVRGKPTRRYELKAGRRAEALDCAVYAHAALLMLGPVRDQLGAIAEELQTAAEEGRQPKFALGKRRSRRVRSRGVHRGGDG